MSNKGSHLRALADFLIQMDKKIDIKMSARGWAYAVEDISIPTYGMITKGEFDLIENAVNKCRKLGYLPVDFVEVEEARKFSGVETPEDETTVEYLRDYLSTTLNCAEYYTPNWWDGEKYYIQMVVEKIDLKSVFQPICKDFHIPIATSKGWSSILQRAEYARRFKLAENDGLTCVLLYCGDHDPDGLRISNFLRKNLEDISNIYWNDGIKGYDPEDLIIERFGLNYDFIILNNLTWIENLVTGSKLSLADPSHKNHHMLYVQEYLKSFGERKCEANAIVKQTEKGRQLCLDTIIRYLGVGATARFEKKRQEIRDEVNSFFEKTKLDETLKAGLEIIDKEHSKEEED